ncbi:MAG: alpha-amylase family glycosyl hydrolase [Planctomycetia bacterium]|nr:alpha-amylase family glycosyl hydrolase [Planctomycetia bacterium]
MKKFLTLSLFLMAVISFLTEAPAVNAQNPKLSEEQKALGDQKARKASDWVQRGIMYQINARAFTREGTMKAAIQKLPVLKQAGITIVYLWPLFEMDQDMRVEYWSPRQIRSNLNNPKNPYRMKDYFTIDPEYGTSADVRKFVEAAHKEGMKVIFDLVYLHCGPSAPVVKEHPEYFQHDSNGKMLTTHWRFPMLDFTKTATREYFWKNMEYWVKECDIDGFRCDVSDGIPLDFWEEGRRRLEKIKPDIAILAEGVRKEDQLFAFDMNYCFSLPTLLSKIRSKGLPVSELRKHLEKLRSERPSGARFIRYIDNHDISNDDYENRKETAWGHDAVESILVMMYTLDGVPMLYCGQEIADSNRHSIYGGGKDYCVIGWSKLQTAEGKNRLAFCKKLSDIRLAHSSLTGSDLCWLDNSCPEAVLSYVRKGEKEKTVVLINWTAKSVNVQLKDSVEIPEKILLSSRTAKKSKDSWTLGPFGYAVYSDR